MTPVSKSIENGFYILIGAVVLLGLYFSSWYSYLLFHTLIEIVTISIAFTLFILTWNTRRYLASNYLRLLGIGYAFIALIDLVHTFAFKGMNIFPGYGANLPTQLWIAARYLQAFTLVAAPLLMERKLDDRFIFAGYAGVVSLLVALIFNTLFPECYIDGQGLTSFKINSEHIIILILLVAFIILYKKRNGFDRRIFILITLSLICTGLSELSFTAYVSVYGYANLIGHFLKLAAFYLIYRAILVTGLRDPFNLIFRDLKHAEEALRMSHDLLEEKVKDRVAELHESDARYRSLIRKVQAAIILHDGQGRLLSSNPLAQELLGLSEDQMLGKALIDPQWHFLREDGTVMSVAEYPVSVVISTQCPYRGQILGINSPDKNDITWVLVNAEPEYDDTGKVTLVIVSFVDVTENRRGVEALRESEKRYQIVADNTYDWEFWIDQNGQFKYISPSCRRITGHTEDEFMSDPDLLNRIIHPADRQRFKEHHGHVMAEKSPGEIEYRIILPDGTIRYIGHLCQPIFDEQGRYLGKRGSNRDISEQKRAEEEIRSLNQELEQRVIDRTAQLSAAIKELESFSYSVSHDLRTPLRGIDGFSQMLLDEYQDKIDEQGKGYLRRVRSAAQRMAQLIDDLLNLSHLNRREMNIQKVSLSELCHEISADLHTAQPDRDVEFIIQDGIEVFGDVQLLRNVMENLIGNAWKFTTMHATARIEFGMQVRKESTTYFIRDDGAGFEMKFAQKIFGAFQRLHTPAEFPGSGIGLATVQRIIHRHGGQVWAEGEVEKGATFYFTLQPVLADDALFPRKDG
ncbi:MAG TPA: MASE3 domain-containing protein [Bacteroidota bacterium]|nr:MASE3 domain-containing protein [Bacteroidota bacterium]